MSKYRKYNAHSLKNKWVSFYAEQTLRFITFHFAGWLVLGFNTRGRLENGNIVEFKIFFFRETKGRRVEMKGL